MIDTNKNKSCFYKEDYTFENFIISPENKAAYDAAKLMAEISAKNVKPLFIYGSPGIGKTHLLSAVLNRLISNNPKIKYINTSSEVFITEFIDSVGSGKLDKFKKKYRKIDVLIIEGIQLFENKEEALYKFGFIIADLIYSERKVILTSDRHPSKFNLNNRLPSIFKELQIIKLNKPGIEARRLYIRHQAEINNINLSEEHVNYIAQKIKSSHRAIDNCISNIFYTQHFTGEPVTLTLLKKEVNLFKN